MFHTEISEDTEAIEKKLAEKTESIEKNNQQTDGHLRASRW